jgi:hypothetical protein
MIVSKKSADAKRRRASRELFRELRKTTLRLKKVLSNLFNLSKNFYNFIKKKSKSIPDFHYQDNVFVSHILGIPSSTF